MIPTNCKTTLTVSEKLTAKWQALVVFVSQGARAADGAAAAAIAGEPASRAAARLLTAGAAKGKARQVVFELMIEEGGRVDRRVYVAGLGPIEKITPETLRQSAAAAAKALAKHQITAANILLPPLPGLPAAEVADAVATGFLLAGFEFTECKGTAHKGRDSDDEPLALSAALVAPSEGKAVAAAVDRARIVCDAQNFCRTLANRPGNEINPPTLASAAKKLATAAGLQCHVFDEKQLTQLKMGGILAVGAGAIHTPPRLIVLEHKPKGAKGKPLLVVGKAITFDTGGISIKPADKMGKMIYDKCGGLAVLGLMYAAAKLKLPVHIVGILSSAENTLSSRAYRPGDILTLYNGVTVEVTNTDAEGRLVLGDALSWGIERFSPAAVVDLATLTGGVIVALGRNIAGLMGNNTALADELIASGARAGEKIWRLPLGDEQRDQIKSDLADIVNSAGREAHVLQGGAFLSYFIPRDDSVAWAHLDIAGVADTEKDLPYYVKGATGWGVRTLVNWAASRAGRVSKS